jgi:hypothetical protein
MSILLSASISAPSRGGLSRVVGASWIAGFPSSEELTHDVPQDGILTKHRLLRCDESVFFWVYFNADILVFIE